MEIIHKVFDCNNPPPEEELTQEQIKALRMWEKDTGKMTDELKKELEMTPTEGIENR